MTSAVPVHLSTTPCPSNDVVCLFPVACNDTGENEMEAGFSQDPAYLKHIFLFFRKRRSSAGRAPNRRMRGQIEMATKNPTFKIILGSSSKARRQILAEMGYEFTVVTADIDEKCIRREKPQDLVVALAEAKADAIVQMLLTDGSQLEEDAPATLLITADTVVVYQGIIREKPTSKEEAREYIKGYSGGHAAVVGSVLVTNLKTGKRYGGWESAEVYFLEIPDEVIDTLIDEGITFNVAGGLMLEHPLTLPYVDAVVGSTDTVMGLSKALTEKLLLEAL